MANSIRKNDRIKGIQLSDKTIKISQLADDTTLLVQDIESVKAVLGFLSDFSTYSGLKLNTSKTEAVWLGRNVNKRDKPLGLHWNNDYFKCLGIWCHTDTTSMIDKNYRERIDKLQHVLNIWQQRLLSLKGKITVLWSIALPQVLYVTSMLYTPGWATNEIDEILFKFLWSNEKPHVKKETIIAETDCGGLKMIHFESMQKAIKLNWIKQLNKMSSNCAVLADFQMNLPIPLTEVFRSKLRGGFIACKCSFYQQLLEYWFELYSVEPENVKDIFEEPLWLNTNIIVGGYPIFYRKWWENDIKYICDICSVDGTIMRKAEIESTFSIVVDQMEYNSVVSAIPDRWRKLIKNQSVSFNDKEIYVHLNGVKKSVDKLKCREIYRFLISKIKKQPTAVKKWPQVYDISEHEWETIFSLPFKICIETDLQTFQYKIINRFFPCNYMLSIWYSESSNMCQYCCKEVDTLVHYFVYCADVVIFWRQFGKMWKRIFEFWFPLREVDIVFGVWSEIGDGNIDTLNYCILFAKFYIYQTKRNGNRIFFLKFLHMLKNRIQVFEAMYISQNKNEQFLIKWSELYNNL